MHSTRSIPLLFVLACALFGRVPALHAQGSTLAEALARVPSDAAFCLSVSHGAELRDTVPGRFVEDAIAVFSGEGEDTELERILNAFGLPAGDAFDELLGRSLVLVIRMDNDGRATWAVRTDVSRRTLRRLRAQLTPTPREVVGGQPLFGVEDGRFTMGIEETPLGGTVTLAPAQNDSLLRAMLKPQADGGLLKLDVFPLSASRVSDADALLYADLTKFPLFNARADAGPMWVGLSVTVQGDGLGMTARLTAPDLAGPQDVPFRPWRTERFEALDDDNALFVMLDRTNNEVLEMLLGNPEKGEPGLLPWRLPIEVTALATHRAACIVSAGKNGTLEAALALESDDVRALADSIDKALPKLINPNSRRLNGIPVSAMRTAKVNTISPLLGKDGTSNLAWTFRVCSDCNDTQETGWWSVGLGPSTVSRLGRALTIDEDAFDQEPEMPWIGIGLVRPGRLLDTISTAGLRIGAEGVLVSRIEELRWHEIRTGSDSSIAAITLSFRDAPEAVAGQQQGGITPVRTRHGDN